MAFDVLDEHEQGELVQKWLRENVLSIVIGIGLGLVLIFGYQQWRRHQASHHLDAATQFSVFTSDLNKKDVSGAKQIAAKLRSDYSDTPYATLSSMQMAEYYATQNDHDSAYAALQSAYANAAIPALKTLSGIYLARSDVARKKPQAALDMLAKLPVGGYAGLIAEVRGDALGALGKNSEARKAYETALTKVDSENPGTTNQKFLEMKLNNIAAEEKKGS